MTKPVVSSDTHSYAQPSESAITHLDWMASVDFDNKVIHATATYALENSSSASKLTLDTKDLDIKSVQDLSGKELTFQLGETKEHLGKPLTIDINPETKGVIISYSTSPKAEALQWLNPDQTADKKEPFLFTQSQAILARTWIPIQDSPGIRFTYSAEVTVPGQLIALMSATNPQVKNDSGVYQFEMKQPIPAYLMALTVGDIDFQSLGDRAGVYAEPSMLKKSAAEFEDLEQMITAAENLYGDYRWDRYDIIVLPPSFPFGGMENPRLTFATPTIIAGDKSLTSLVAHELAHSWSGNLVTNATWNDFWLNEGFTVYFEYRIMEALYGREYSEMLALLSYQDLKEEIKDISEVNPADTHLKLDLEGRNPDDGLTAIAYDKGYFFLRLLEESVGREKWDQFLKNYFNQNAFEVMTTKEFVEILNKELLSQTETGLDSNFYDAWIYGPGLPDNCPVPVSNKFENVDQALTNWLENEDAGQLIESFGSDSWSTHEWMHFIRSIPDNYSSEKMAALDEAFGFTQSGNSEIFSAWAIHIINNQYEPGYDALSSFLIQTGRRKFLTPLYKAMIQTESGKAMALEIYEKARPNYHSVAYNTMDDLLGYN
ncbi:M1 family metallopeptidase [Reichenbachiella ulvae]|uniref:Aminopeptidase N n=1 Tax=Reichenbachiella ulvae TaxID=2980104 RepID=A0ABT3CZ54_9BACT|nr:M1 family metallopeptidase [Reichenbachiella ulvae]MCV9388977.1 M1 family metallopeptidase [Reichenbachiella ulvae]